MPEAPLIPLLTQPLGSESKQTVNARDLHAFLGIKTRFNDWIVKRIEQYGFVQDIDFTLYCDSSNTNKVQAIDYYISLEMAKELSMVERTAKGKEARLYFLDCERVRLQETPKALPTLHDPAYAMLLRAVIDLDTTRHDLAVLQAQQQHQHLQTIEALQRAAHADHTAHLALDDAHTMTIETFVLKNGLLHQYPRARWRGMAHWLLGFCQHYNLKVFKDPTVGTTWGEENAYPIRALAAWLEHDTHTARQMHLVSTDDPVPVPS